MEQELGSKQYISIIRLFESIDISTENEINVGRIKKQILAEFSIAENGIITIDGFNYNKSSVVEEIDKIDFSERLKYHKIIWDSKRLLELLETNKTNLDEMFFDFEKIPNDENFDAFLSPYLAEPFNVFSRNLLVNYNFQDLSTLLRYQDFILPFQTEIAYSSINNFLVSNLRILNNTSKDNFHLMYEQISFWIDRDWYLFFNMLPEDFYSIKDQIIRKLVNMTVYLQKERRNKAIALSWKLVNLINIDQEVSSTIHGNDAIFNGYNTSSSSSDSGSINWKLIIWPIVILLKLLAMGGC